MFEYGMMEIVTTSERASTIDGSSPLMDSRLLLSEQRSKGGHTGNTRVQRNCIVHCTLEIVGRGKSIRRVRCTNSEIRVLRTYPDKWNIR